MKKVLFSMIVAIAATLAFSSCSKSEDDITLSDVANSTFKASSSAIKDFNEENPSNQLTSYEIVFGATTYQLSVVASDGTTTTVKGEFSVANNVITLTSADDEDYEGYTFKGDGSKKIIDELFKITLKKD